MIQLHQLSKYYFYGKKEKINVLNNIDCILLDSGIVSIIGESGCGKSTLLQLISGIIPISSGEILIDKKSTFWYKKKQWQNLRKDQIGYVFQHYYLIEALTVFENVKIASFSNDDQKAMDALKQVGMEEYKDYFPSMLSGGQQQRVAIARAICKEPKYLFADEPTGALDADTSIEIMNVLKEISKHCLVVIVSHDLELVNEYSDQIIEIEDKKATLKKQQDQTLLSRYCQRQFNHLNFKHIVNIVFYHIIKKKQRFLVTSLAQSFAITFLFLMILFSSNANEMIHLLSTKSITNNIVMVEGNNIKEKLKDIKNIKEIYQGYDTSNVTITINNDIYTPKLLPIIKENILNDHILKGNVFGENEIMINKKLYDSYLEKNDQEMIGNTIKFQINDKWKEFKISGVIEEMEESESYIYFDKNVLNDFLPMDHKIGYVVVTDHSHVKEVVNQCNEIQGIFASNQGLTLQETYSNIIVFLQVIVIFFIIVCQIISAALILVIIYASLLERKKEIGILKTIGISHIDIFKIFETEMAALGLTSGIISVLSILPLVPILNPIIKSQFGSMKYQLLSYQPFHGAIVFFIIIIIFSVMITLSIGAIPIYKGAKLKIDAALKEE